MVIQLCGAFEIPIANIQIPEEYNLEIIGKGRIRTSQTSGY